MSFIGAGKEMIKAVVNKFQKAKPKGQAKKGALPQGGQGFSKGHGRHLVNPRVLRVLAEKERRRNS